VQLGKDQLLIAKPICTADDRLGSKAAEQRRGCGQDVQDRHGDDAGGDPRRDKLADGRKPEQFQRIGLFRDPHRRHLGTQSGTRAGRDDQPGPDGREFQHDRHRQNRRQQFRRPSGAFQQAPRLHPDDGAERHAQHHGQRQGPEHDAVEIADDIARIRIGSNRRKQNRNEKGTPLADRDEGLQK